MIYVVIILLILSNALLFYLVSSCVKVGEYKSYQIRALRIWSECISFELNKNYPEIVSFQEWEEKLKEVKR